MIGKAEELADSLNDTLSTKYYWRDWLVVVYSDMTGSKNHWRHTCNRNVTTLDLIHWNQRYNILISSVPSDKKSEHFTLTKRVTTHKSTTIFGMKRTKWFDAKMVFENLPDDAKTCKYPIRGVVKSPKVAVRAPKNRRFQQKDEVIDIFVLG